MTSRSLPTPVVRRRNSRLLYRDRQRRCRPGPRSEPSCGVPLCHLRAASIQLLVESPLLRRLAPRSSRGAIFVTMPARRFPPPWTVREAVNTFRLILHPTCVIQPAVNGCPLVAANSAAAPAAPSRIRLGSGHAPTASRAFPPWRPAGATVWARARPTQDPEATPGALSSSCSLRCDYSAIPLAPRATDPATAPPTLFF